MSIFAIILSTAQHDFKHHHRDYRWFIFFDPCFPFLLQGFLLFGFQIFFVHHQYLSLSLEIFFSLCFFSFFNLKRHSSFYLLFLLGHYFLFYSFHWSVLTVSLIVWNDFFSFISHSTLSSVTPFHNFCNFGLCCSLTSYVRDSRSFTLFWKCRCRSYLFGLHDFLRCLCIYFAPFSWSHGFACFVLCDCFLLPTFEKLTFGVLEVFVEQTLSSWNTLFFFFDFSYSNEK